MSLQYVFMHYGFYCTNPACCCRGPSELQQGHTWGQHEGCMQNSSAPLFALVLGLGSVGHDIIVDVETPWQLEQDGGLGVRLEQQSLEEVPDTLATVACACHRGRLRCGHDVQTLSPEGGGRVKVWAGASAT